MIAGELSFYLIAVKKMFGMSCVLGSDEVNFPQHADRPEGDVFEVPDGCGDYVEGSDRHIV